MVALAEELIARESLEGDELKRLLAEIRPAVEADGGLPLPAAPLLAAMTGRRPGGSHLVTDPHRARAR